MDYEQHAWQAWEREQDRLRYDPEPDPDPDLTPTQPAMALVSCAYMGCTNLVPRIPGYPPCCRVHRAGLDALRDLVDTGFVSDWQTMCHRDGLAMHRVKGVAAPALARFKQIVVNHCYKTRWWPWREPFYEGPSAA